MCLTCHQTGPLGPGGREIETGRLFISITKGQTPPTTLECQEYDYELDSVEGIEVGDIYSLKIGANYDFYGKVTHLDTNNNIVTISSFTEGTTTDLSDAVMWFPYKPQIGTQVNGGAQSARGYTTTALNWGSSSEGFYTLAEGKYSHAQNHSTIAGYAAHAEGQNTKALGEWSHAQGMATSALNRYTFSFGNSTVSMENYFNGKVLTTLKNEEIEKAWKNANPKFTCANGYASTAGGNNTLALGAVSTALGKETIAKGNNSLSTGYLTSAEGENSASFGHNTHAIGDNSIAIGDNNTAYGKNSITFGSNNNNITEWEEYGKDETYLYDDSPNNCIDSLQIEGSENIIKKSQPGPLGGKTIIKNSHIEGANNQFDVRYYSEMKGSHIEGSSNKIDGMDLYDSHIEGLSNNISYEMTSGGKLDASHVEGYKNKINGTAIQSHIEGTENTIQFYQKNGIEKENVCVHVEGYKNKILNSNYSHTQGTTNTVTNSPSSHVGGWNNKITNADSAFAHGHCLISNNEACNTTFGKYNAPVAKTYFSIGNGTDKNRSNAFLVYIDGHAELPSLKNKNGELDSTAIGTSDYAIVTKGYVAEAIQPKMDKFADVTVEENAATINNDGQLSLNSEYLSLVGRSSVVIKSNLISLNANYIDVLNAHLSNLAEPENASDAATKGYVDNAIITKIEKLEAAIVALGGTIA